MPNNENTKFVNSLFLKNLVETIFREKNVVIKSYSAEKAYRGDNEATARSSMNRVLLRYSAQELPDNVLSLVVKIKPTKGQLAEEFKKCDVFEKETEIYKTIIPAMNAILKKTGGKIELAPELIYSAEVPTDFLILEDLTTRGFSTEDQQRGLDFEQSKMALEKLAFFHAASVFLLEADKDNLMKFANGTFHTSNKEGLKYFENALKNFVDNTSDLGIDAVIAEKLKTLIPKIIQKGIEVYSSGLNGFNVLNHGDFWTSNIMFKYHEGQLIDTIFIDYQNCVIGSPVIDLIYFLTSSVACDVLEAARDELIYAYHETLMLILQKLGYTGHVPSLNDLQIELLKKGALEVIFSLTTAPYLRTVNSKVCPAIQPVLYKEALCPDAKVHMKAILELHQVGLRHQLKKFDSLGLLDWGASDGKVKGLLSRFQR